MSAEKGWIGEPQPEKEWHTPGWLSERYRSQPLPLRQVRRQTGLWRAPGQFVHGTDDGIAVRCDLNGDLRARPSPQSVPGDSEAVVFG